MAAVRPDDLAALVIKEVIARGGIEPDLVEDVYLGCTNQAGEYNRNVARMALLLAGLRCRFPEASENDLHRLIMGLLWGEDMEVPPMLTKELPLPAAADQIATPGAARSGLSIESG